MPKRCYYGVNEQFLWMVGSSLQGGFGIFATELSRHTRMRLIIFVTFCFALLSAEAQDKWSLEECIKYAMDNNIVPESNILNMAEASTTNLDDLPLSPQNDGNIQLETKEKNVKIVLTEWIQLLKVEPT